MSRRARYVFDTNVVVSAVLFENSNPAKVFRCALERGEILLSLEMLEELSNVLERDKFSRFITREERDEFLQAFVERATLIKVVETI